MIPPTSAESDAEDVNDFLRRIQELGQRRDQEDEERNRKLEEEIMQGRRERQARRAEHARSISPSKGSPMQTPPPLRSPATRQIDPVALSPSPLKPSFARGSPLVRSTTGNATIQSSEAASIHCHENSMPASEYMARSTSPAPLKSATTGGSSMEKSPSRTSTLSWQQRRPLSQASDTSKTRPPSMFAVGNTTRAIQSSTNASRVKDEPVLSRDQIAQSLAAKDPAWFRQTDDKNRGSAAFRKNQVEDADVVAHGQVSHLTRMPGMSRSVDVQKIPNVDGGRSSPSLESSTSNRSTFSRSTNSTNLPGTSTLSPPRHKAMDHESMESTNTAAMSPSQSRMSRPISPTKGLGGFVQSAMMKRSDSVNKRWSVPSPIGLGRADSVVSSKNTLESAIVQGVAMTPAARHYRGSTLSREASPRSRPRSTYGDVTTTSKTDDRPSTSESTRSRTTSFSTEGATSLPHLESSYTHRSETSDIASGSMRARSRSPTKWSPTKSSWLESALSRPESPKPKTAQSPLQPSWMSEINKAKVRNANDASSSKRTLHTHTLSNGQLIDPPSIHEEIKTTEPPTSPGVIISVHSRSITTDHDGANRTRQFGASERGVEASSTKSRKVSNGPPLPSTPKPSLSSFTDTKVLEKLKLQTPPKKDSRESTKPQTPPKKDFRTNLKPRQPSPDTRNVEQPEFKSLRSQLRGTKTQNYVAPDVLRDNILRGKADLATTGGPKKTTRKDDFKDAILEKKEMYKKLQAEGKGVTRSPSDSSQGSPAPEALVRAKSVRRSDIDNDLIRSRSASRGSRAPSPVPEALIKVAAVRRPSPSTKLAATMSSTHLEKSEKSEELQQKPLRTTNHIPYAPNLRQEASSPARLQNSKSTTDLATKFNPALATLLARGPPSTHVTKAELSPVVGNANVASNKDEPEEGPQLVHMTKARARGPKRKAPSTKTVTTVGEDTRPTRKSPDLRAQTIAKSEAIDSSSSPISTTAQSSTVSDSLPKQKLAVRPAKPAPIAIDTNTSPAPKKLDMKRRSQFLADSPVPSSPKESPRLRSSSPVKDASFAFEKLSSTPTKSFRSTPLMSPRTPKSPFMANSAAAISPRTGPGAPPKPRNLSGAVRSVSGTSS